MTSGSFRGKKFSLRLILCSRFALQFSWSALSMKPHPALVLFSNINYLSISQFMPVTFNIVTESVIGSTKNDNPISTKRNSTPNGAILLTRKVRISIRFILDLTHVKVLVPVRLLNEVYMQSFVPS
ncbi:hypothetical protein C8R41DRAFT_852764 [Lentinula lateritia]|uniref:Uncharacterized protein n=1 Tax=Lentinula lateritia TaxID=40482 RepID=A0ABQ8V602_9AGAR|nr:hypothetical protein C8R41DRAFT_852764 [Lentinula lateritia]